MTPIPAFAAAVALIVLVSSFNADVALAQESPGPLGFAYAYNVFALDDTTSLVEIDYLYFEQGLVYERVDGEQLGRLRVRISVWDSTGRKFLENSWITTNERPKEGDEDHALLGVKLFGVHPGRHRARIAFEDVAEPSRRDSAEFELAVRRFPRNRIALSDAQIISEISPSEDETNRFYKNGYIIYPNVLSTIDPPFLLLNSYLEIYNANLAPTSQFEIAYALADSTGKSFYLKDEKRDRPTSDAIVDVHSLELDELPSGTYYFIVKAFAGLKGTATDSAMIVKSFTLSNPDKDSIMATRLTAQPGASVAIDPIFAGMTEAELDAEFVMLKYISIERERQVWEQLSGVEAKSRFLSEFWARRDPNVGTPENELRQEYQQRIEQANKMYNEPLVEHGYMSDRGRVLLQYGRPDGIDRHYYDKNRKPYEIWVYSKDAIEFVFVDRSGLGRYQLVHSTAPAEKKQQNWLRLYATIHEYLDN